MSKGPAGEGVGTQERCETKHHGPSGARGGAGPAGDPAIRWCPAVFLGVALAVFLLSVFLPALILSLVRKPWTYFAFNAWLPNLPDYLLSGGDPLGRRLAFLWKLALFWFNADGPYGSVEWGYAVDVSSLARAAATALLVAAYFALWRYERARAPQCAWSGPAGRGGGTLGALAGALGLSAGPCSVVGCGAPVLPVIGLAFSGLSSGTLYWLSTLSRVATTAILLALAAGVVYLGWRVGERTPGATAPAGR